MSPPTRVLVLSESVRDADLLAYAATAGWTTLGETPRAHLGMASRQYQTRDGTDVLQIDDHTGEVRSLRITGAHADEVARAVGAALPTDDMDALRAIVEKGDPRACIRAAGRLAAGRPEQPDSAHLRALQRLLSHEHVAVRRAGIRAAYGCRWPELRAWLGARMQVEDRLRDALRGLVSWIDEPLPPA